MSRPVSDALVKQAVAALKRNFGNVTHAARDLGIPKGTLENRLERARNRGIWEDPPEAPIPEPVKPFAAENVPPPSYTGGHAIEVLSAKDNTFLFGSAGDLHAASKYTRWDVRDELYKWFADEGAVCNFDTGNWIDGEAPFNRYDIEIAGFDGQIRMLAERHPKNVPTYAVWGDDHEGWYVQREGIDVGAYAEHVMRGAGHDWTNLGFMEASVALKNANSGKIASMAVVHPGGGSAYALSYSIQKIIECVPLKSEILTKQGWARHDEVDIGDCVLGYNVETDRCEWTTITGVHRGTSSVVRYSNDQFEVECTPNHRWAIEWEQRAGPNPASREPKPYSRRDRLICPIDDTKPRSRIIQAAVAPNGPGLQSFTHSEWLIRSPEASRRVLQMTSGERRAFIEGLLLGEGTIGGGIDRGYRTVIFCQRPGPVNDAFRLACFLEGIATTDRPCHPGRLKPDQEPARRVVMLAKPMRICDKLNREELGEQEVWCVSTDLGTWVMRQGTTITITGNSYEGGEKPAVGLYGHYHKLWNGLIRNVWVAQTGTQQDQTPFMRKKRLEAHVGGCLIKLTQDPATGAIVRMQCEMARFFNRDYYGLGNRWSRHGAIVRPARSR